LAAIFDLELLKKELQSLQEQTDSEDVWNNQEKAKLLFKQKNIVQEKIELFEDLEKRLGDCTDLAKMAWDEKDEQLLDEMERELESLAEEAERVKIELFFSGESDSSNCFIDINAGAGGTESHDWASMMMRMYLRFAEKLRAKAEVVSIIDGEEAGIKSCTIQVKGKNSYGWLKTEIGVHRLVRISPFNAAGKRMTSFASCWVYPEVNEDIDIEIDEKDLRIDTYRSSGAGGQHVNTTDSAVRITHIPTNIAVACQNERSQHKNKASAMKMLKARLYNLELQKREDELSAQNATKSDNSWGHQIRSYVLQPYQLVKDLRTDHETSDVHKVLDGELKDFVAAALSQKIGK
jgi:peptide chain release factor 2